MDRVKATIAGLILLFSVSPVLSAQQCGTGASSETAGRASPETLARRNIDLLFEGIRLTADERKNAVRIFADAWNAMIKLGSSKPDDRQKFNERLLERNRQLLALVKSGADSAKLVGCFKKMGQPAPDGTPPQFVSRGS
jgi:hypothetical protein